MVQRTNARRTEPLRAGALGPSGGARGIYGRYPALTQKMFYPRLRLLDVAEISGEVLYPHTPEIPVRLDA
jgi:hypothetical protein